MAKKKFSSGKNAYSYSERSGERFPYDEMIKEPGTELWVHQSESDGKWNRVDHQQNYAPKNIGENQSLKHVFGDGYDGNPAEQQPVPVSDWLNRIRPPVPNVTGFDSGFDNGFGA